MRALPVLLLTLFCVLASSALTLLLLPVRPEPAPGDGKRLEERLERLERSVAALAADRAATATPSANGVGAAPAATTLEVDSPEQPTIETRLRAVEELLEVAAPGAAVSVRDSEKTRAALESLERDEMQSRIARWITRETERANLLVSAIEKRLALTDSEKQALQHIFAEEKQAQGKILDELWGNTPAGDVADGDETLGARWDDGVERMKSIREQRDKKLRELLGDDRYANLERLSRESAKAKRERD